MGLKCQIAGKDYEFEQLRPGDLFKAAKWLKEQQIRDAVGNIAFSPIALVPPAVQAELVAKMFAAPIGRQDVLRSDQGRMYVVYLACKPGIEFEQWVNTITPDEYDQLELIAFRLANINVTVEGEGEAPLVKAPAGS